MAVGCRCRNSGRGEIGRADKRGRIGTVYTHGEGKCVVVLAQKPGASCRGAEGDGGEED